MNLAEMLSYSDIHQLSHIANHYECECDGHSKKELIQSILTAMNRRGVLEQYIQSLGIEDIRFINSLLFDNRDSFSLEELIARAKQAKFNGETGKEINPREMIAKFKHHGWLFNGYSQQTKFLFQIPQDVKLKFFHALSRQFQTELHTIDNPPAYRDEQRLLLDDILVFLQFVYHNEIPLTAEGVMYKRTLQQILGLFAVSEEMVARAGWRFGYGRKFRDYPNRFSFIYDYCYYHNMIIESPDGLILTEYGQQQALGNKKEDLLEVYRFWLRLYKGPIEHLQSIVRWIERLTDTWVTVESLKMILCPLIKPYYYDTAESIFEQRIVSMMKHLGLCRIGATMEQQQVIQVTKLGSSVIHGTYVGEEETIIIPLDG